MSPAHIPHDELAAFIDGTGANADRERVRAHLETCRECYEAYRDAARALGTPDHNELSRLPADVAARVMNVMGRRQENARDTRRFPRRMVGAIAAAVVVITAFGLWNGTQEKESDSPIADLERVTRSIAAAGGKMVFPGTEAILPEAGPAYRSTSPDAAPGFSSSLNVLYQRFRNSAASVDETYWLAAGYAAAGEVGLAREVILVSRSRSVDDPRFDVIDAVLAYRNSDLSRAREKLERAIESMPRSAEVHLDLAIVLHELGEDELAAQHLSRAHALATGTALRSRGL